MYSNHKPIFWIVFSLLFALIGCTEEFDVISEIEIIEEPKIGEPVFFRGTVRDTSEQGIKNASLRIQFDDFTQDILTDSEGAFEIEIPQTDKSGLVITGKPKYSRSIQPVNQVNGDINKDIYLLEQSNVSQVDLEVNDEQLFFIRGRFIDQFGVPIPEILIYGESEMVTNEEVKYSTKTEQDGSFEFIIERADYAFHLYFATLYAEPCFDQTFNFRSHTNDTLLDWGDVVFPISSTYEIFPQVEVNDCVDIDYINHIYRPGYYGVLSERLSPNQSFVYCDTNALNSWMYSGVVSLDEANFNGQFLKQAGFEQVLSYDLCTPEGRFLELNLAEDKLLFVDISEEGAINDAITGRMIMANSASNTLAIKLSGSFSSSSNNGSYSYTRISSMELRDSAQNILFTLDPNGPNLVNLINGGRTANQGVGTAQINWADGRTELVNIRIRL